MSKKYFCAVNPQSGSGEALKMFSVLKKEFPDDELILMESKGPGYFSRFMDAHTLEGIDAILVLGGDGTMHDIVNALYDLKRLDIPVMLFPAGSGNAFNHDLQCFNFRTALERFKKGNTIKVDLLEVNYNEQSCIAFNMLGWGLVTRINMLAEDLRMIGNIRYTIAALTRLFPNQTEELTIEIDGEQMQDNFSFVLALNTQHTGKGMRMAPLAKLDDGLMDVLLVRKAPLLDLLFLFPKIYSGKHIHSKLLEYKQCKSLRVISKDRQQITIDGELKGESPFSVKISEHQLKIIN